ncbi:MAG: PAN domain-containing protein [Nitrospirota bacterium]|nr:PAN domain-containing protein [Nitrospirota bacterium]
MKVRDHALPLFFVCAVTFTGCATEQTVGRSEASSSPPTASTWATTIELIKPVHFSSADGAGLLAPAGQYVVDATAQSQVRLMPEQGTSPFVLTAALQAHDIDIATPVAVTFSEREDEPHVLLLLPDGRALDAIGSFNGVRSREVIRTNRLYSLYAEAGVVRLGSRVVETLPSDGPASTSSHPRAGLGSFNELSSVGDTESMRMQLYMERRSKFNETLSNILAKQNQPFQFEVDWDRPGGDYAQRAEPTPESCRLVCAANPSCQAFTFVKAASGAALGQCFLKRTEPPPVANRGCISGKRTSLQEGIIKNMK